METETRRRFANYGGPDQPDTHEDEFRDAFKRQRRAADAVAALPVLDEEIASETDVRTLQALARRRIYLVRMIAKGEESADEDAETLRELDPVEVVEVETVSGPRRITADRAAQYESVLGVEEDVAIDEAADEQEVEG